MYLYLIDIQGGQKQQILIRYLNIVNMYNNKKRHIDSTYLLYLSKIPH